MEWNNGCEHTLLHSAYCVLLYFVLAYCVWPYLSIAYCEPFNNKTFQWHYLLHKEEQMYSLSHAQAQFFLQRLFVCVCLYECFRSHLYVLVLSTIKCPKYARAKRGCEKMLWRYMLCLSCIFFKLHIFNVNLEVRVRKQDFCVPALG